MARVNVKRQELDAVKKRLGDVLKKFHGEHRAHAVAEVHEFLGDFDLDARKEDEIDYDDLYVGD